MPPISPDAPSWDELFADRILPRLGVSRGGVSRPRWIFVCGQPGAGKSTLIRQLLAELGPDRTQLISSDALHDLLPELFGEDDPDPATLARREAFTQGIRQSWFDALVDRAVALGAHLIWERPVPTDMAEVAILARAMGYQVDCTVLAVPLLDSWLASLQRETAPDLPANRVPSRIDWSRLQTAYSRWPAFLAQVEDRVSFDRLQIVGRDGQPRFENRGLQKGDLRRWQDPPFAVESLLVERLAPYVPGQIEALLNLWNDLRAHPDIAFRNHAAWPHASILAAGDMLGRLASDPSASFDLGRASETPNPQAAQGWIDRLRAEAAAALALPDAPATLAPRIDRLLALVSQLAGA